MEMIHFSEEDSVEKRKNDSSESKVLNIKDKKQLRKKIVQVQNLEKDPSVKAESCALSRTLEVIVKREAFFYPFGERFTVLSH